MASAARASGAARGSRSFSKRWREGRPLDWTERILDFPVRTAAVDSFLKELRAKNAADLNAVLVTFNEGSLCREAVGHWVLKRWITIAPHSPLTAIAGPEFRRDITLPEFCGREEGADADAPPFDMSDEGGETGAKGETGAEEGDREKT